YEFSLAVDITDDEDDGNYAIGDLSLREAIKLANANPGADTITFGVTGTINLTGALPDLSSDITITGPGANVLNVGRAADATTNYRIFTIGSGITAAISGLTLSNGFADYGGGISNMGTLELTNCTVNDNTAHFGGGIYNGGTLVITNSTISGSSSNFQGGGIENIGTLELTN